MNDTVNPSNLIAPPCDINLERAVIGGILSNTESYSIVRDILKPEHFFDNLSKTIYESAISAYDEFGYADLTSVMTTLRKNNQLDSIGGMMGLMGLMKDGELSVNMFLSAATLHELATRRNALHLAYKLVEDVRDNSKDIYDVLADVESSANEITETSSTSKDIFSIDEVVRSNSKLIEESKQRGDGLSGITTGFDSLDERIHGLPQGAMVILAARPSVGKSAFAVNMMNKIVDRGKKVALFSYEMSPESIVSRMICAYTNISYSSLRSGRLTENELILKLREDARLSEQRNSMFICQTDPSISSFKSTARRLKNKYDIDCIILDYLQLLSSKGNNRQEEVSNISRSVKALAMELNIPIVALSQLNRGVTSRNDKTPQLSDLRESGSIEQDADIVIFLHRPEYYGDHTDDEGKTEVIVAKQRDGALGALPFTYVGKSFRFEEPPKEEVLVYPMNNKRESWIEKHNVQVPQPLPPQPDNVLPF